MSLISVVTVTFNNAAGLRETLGSLARLQCGPLEIVVIDGGSSDDTPAVVREFEARLPLAFTSEPDRGIYDAMNKGHASCCGDLVHYLNAGDTVFGEPYTHVMQDCLLPVHVHDESGGFFFEEFVRHSGFGYCHQGILFPRGHPSYRLEYRVAADLDVMIATYPRGMNGLPRVLSGGVRYALGGVSSQAGSERDREVRKIFFSRLPWWVASRLQAGIVLKNLLPRSLRRSMVKRLRGAETADRSRHG